MILQLHRDLYSFSRGAVGGNYKNSDNLIAEIDAEGHEKVRFIPVPAFQTAEAVEELCNRFWEAWEADYIDKLILIPMFVLDFLCIHPFNDGSGRSCPGEKLEDIGRATDAGNAFVEDVARMYLTHQNGCWL